MLSPARTRKKGNLAPAAADPPGGTESRPAGQFPHPRTQGRAWGGRRSPTARSINGPCAPPPVGQQQHRGGQYDPATRVSPSPGARTPGLAPKPPRRGRQGVFRTQNRPKVPPGATMASQLPWQLNFSCNQLAISVHVDGPECLSTHWGRWVPRKSIRATPYASEEGHLYSCSHIHSQPKASGGTMLEEGK